jgi:hypothetical protein
MDHIHVRRRDLTTAPRDARWSDRIAALTGRLRPRRSRPGPGSVAGAGGAPRSAAGGPGATAGLQTMNTLGAGRR